jgi:hypothetical protein
MVSLEKISAHALMDEMRKYKSLEDPVVQPNGSTKTARATFIPVMEAYSRNYDEYELKKIIGPKMIENIKNMDTTELHIRMHHIRMLLAQMIVKSTDYACVTLNIAGFNFAYIYVLLGDPITIEYISLGDSVKSYDGEWRGMMMNNATFDYLVKHYGSSIDKLVDTMKFKQTPKVNIYYNTSMKQEVNDSLYNLVGKTQLGPSLLALSWFIAAYERECGNISPTFAKFGSLGGSLDIDRIIGKSISDEIYTILGSIFDVRVSQQHLTVDERAVRTGQKLIQLTPDEASHPLNNSFQAWNEIAVTNDALDLVLNLICPGFAISSFWLMIYETSKFMYNVKDMHARIAQSQTIRLTPADKRTDKVLASEAVCVVNEYCGPTFRHSLTDKVLRDHTLRHGVKYVFEIIYAIFCLHSRLEQFHGDFHCDNATIMRLTSASTDADWKIAYIIGADAFVMNHDGSFGCVIDFSRSIALDNPVWIERVIEKYELHIGKISDDARSYFDANVYAALDDPKILDRLKRVATAFDIYEFAHTSLTQCKDELKGTPVGDLLGSIRDTSKEIISGLAKLTDDAADPPEWAARIILQKYWTFCDIAQLKTRAGTFRGVYTYDNPMTYSARSYEELPCSIAKNPMIRDVDDEPVDTYANAALKIKARYQMRKANLAETFGIGPVH